MAEEWEWIGWLGIPARPDSPSGGPGPGFFGPAGPRPPSTGGLLDPHSPAARGLSGSDVELMLNQHRAEAAIGRADRAADLRSLRFAADTVLGHYSFGAGVSYGLVKSPTAAIADLLELGRIFVLADFYDRIYGNQQWRFTFGPAVFAETGLRLMLATGLMSRSIIESAHQERDAILTELEHIISNPLESLASIPAAVAAKYAAQWREYQLHAASRSLEDQFKAGTILGELLFEVLSLVAGIGSGVAAAAKLAARAPKLARFSRAVLGGKGGGGAAGELAVAASRPSRSAAGVAKTPSQLAAETRAAPPPVKRAASPVSRAKKRMDALRNEGHGPQRHGPAVTDQQLEDRAIHKRDPMTGTTTDGVHGGQHQCGRHATRVNSDEAYVQADDHLRASDDFEQQRKANEQTGGDEIVVDKPLEDIYGPDYQDNVSGVMRNGSNNYPTGNPPGSAPPSATNFENGTMKGIYRKNLDGTYRTHTIYPNQAP